MQNTKIAKDLYAAFGRKDGDGLRRLLHPEVEWIQCPGFPGGGHRRGADEVLEKVLGGLNAEWNDFRTEIDEYLETANGVVVLGRYTGVHATSGLAMDAVFAHVYDVEDGRVRRFRQYTDTHEIVKAMPA